MSLGVLNNLSAVYAENNLSNTNNSLSKTLQQLSSGSKINSGADDAAGLSLVSGLAANSAALMQSGTNAQEGVGLLQVADGALSQVTSLLNRAVTLATEASNGTLNSSQDAAANQEYQSILSEINNIGTTTTYNQQKVFGTGSDTTIYTGDSSSQGAAVDNLHFAAVSSTTVGDAGGTVSGTNVQQAVFLDLGTTATTSQNDTLASGKAMTFSYELSNGSTGVDTITTSNSNGTTSVNGLIQAIDNLGLGLTASFSTAAAAGGSAPAGESGILISGLSVEQGTTPSTPGTTEVTNPASSSGIYDTSSSQNAGGVGVAVSTAATGTGVSTIKYTAAGSNASENLSGLGNLSQGTAQAILTGLNTAISDVAAQDGYIGSQINTLNAVSQVLSTQSENVTAAQNAVQATDYASASSNMSKYEILSQTGISALAQANSVQQEVTKLLQ